MTYTNITRPFSSTTNRRIGSCLIFVGTLLWIWLPYSYWQQKKFVVDAIVTTATILKRDGAPLVSFRTASGETIAMQLSGWYHAKPKPGEKIEVAYSPNNQRVEEKSSLWTEQWTIAIGALASTIIGWLTRAGMFVWGPLKRSWVQIDS